MVRLKAFMTTGSLPISKISIPYGAIKRSLIKEKMKELDYFNSLWCD